MEVLNNGIELHRMPKSYQLIDLNNNRECTFIRILHNDNQEDVNTKIEGGINYLLARRG